MLTGSSYDVLHWADQPTSAIAWPNVMTGVDRCDRPHLPAPPTSDKGFNKPQDTTTDQGTLIFLWKRSSVASILSLCLHVCREVPQEMFQ